jgi:hypothetical protein
MAVITKATRTGYRVMFNQILASLGRLIPKSPPIVVATPEDVPERGWHGSSFDLARGLEVTEIGAEVEGKPRVFADTQPAWHPSPPQARAAA